MMEDLRAECFVFRAFFILPVSLSVLQHCLGTPVSMPVTYGAFIALRKTEKRNLRTDPFTVFTTGSLPFSAVVGTALIRLLGAPRSHCQPAESTLQRRCQGSVKQPPPRLTPPCTGSCWLPVLAGLAGCSEHGRATLSLA